jgi:signal transduction histidine kinase
MAGGGVPRARSHPDRLRGETGRARGDYARASTDSELAQFLAVVSHEMRTPLTSIISFSELLRGEAAGLSPEGLRFLGIIERNADRLLRLIDDLLLLNRLEAGGQPLELALVTLPDLAAEAVRSAAPVAAKSGVTVLLDAGQGPAVLADPRRLAQVLDNLIGNAVKFSHVDGLVRVRLRYMRGAWRIDVADTGIGIPADEAARLFGLFVRGSNARTAGLPGTGLGLAIVKSLVEMHGGHVKVESVLDHGTTFSVFLPVRAAAPARDRESRDRESR